MRTPKWLSVAMVMAIHDEALYYFGGMGGVRDPTLLESAIDRPRNKLAYAPQASLFDLAASLGVGIVRNFAFLDGNKRTALLATRAFLFLNGCALEPEERDEVLTMLGVATGEVSEAAFARWLEVNCEGPKTRRRRTAKKQRKRT